MITSDHGEYLGEHGLMDHMQGVSRCVLNVPLLIRAPGHFDGGDREDDVVRLEDVAPTIMELCGLPPVAGLDGLSLTADLADRAAFGESWPVPMFVQTARRLVDPAIVDAQLRSSRSIVSGRFHLIEHSDGRTHLYDLRADPGEREDLAASRPDDIARLRAIPR